MVRNNVQGASLEQLPTLMHEPFEATNPELYLTHLSDHAIGYQDPIVMLQDIAVNATYSKLVKGIPQPFPMVLWRRKVYYFSL